MGWSESYIILSLFTLIKKGVAEPVKNEAFLYAWHMLLYINTYSLVFYIFPKHAAAPHLLSSCTVSLLLFPCKTFRTTHNSGKGSTSRIGSGRVAWPIDLHGRNVINVSGNVLSIQVSTLSFNEAFSSGFITLSYRLVESQCSWVADC